MEKKYNRNKLKYYDYEPDGQTDDQSHEQTDTTNIPDLESKESAPQRNNQKPIQSPRVTQILTPNQMLSQLSIILAQVLAEKNPQKLKNEIRQLLYNLYCSKEITKNVCNYLIKTV